MRKLLLVVALFCLNVFARAERDSSALRISLLTCTPGSELYSIFGHNALRIVDSAAGTDVVYNYGTFNFNDPDFYSKFVRGKLMYFLSQSSYPDFLFEYDYFKRGVVEQVLLLNGQEKKELQQFMFDNVREDNRYYKYDFLYDNCTTRLRDIIFRKNSNAALQPKIFTSYGRTFRDHLHGYLDKASMPWTALGIDLLLGVGADKPMDAMEVMFLPDYLAQGVSLGTEKGKKIMLEESIVLPDAQPAVIATPFWQTPIFCISVFSLILLLPLALKNQRWQQIADNFLFILSGLLGLLLLFMWFGTDHQSFSKNLNLIWAMPTNLVIAFLSRKDAPYLRKYFNVYSILIIMLLAIGLLYRGSINYALFPLMAVLSLRTWMLSRAEKNMLKP
jgi:hypothetical protein